MAADSILVSANVRETKYLLVVKAENRPDQRFKTDDEDDVVDWLAAFRQEYASPRIELHTTGVPGYEWWDKENYYIES